MNDTPEVLKAYAEARGAKEGWTFLTGSKQNIDWAYAGASPRRTCALTESTITTRPGEPVTTATVSPEVDPRRGGGSGETMPTPPGAASPPQEKTRQITAKTRAERISPTIAE